MNQGKIGSVSNRNEEEHLDISRISEIAMTGMGDLISDDYYVFGHDVTCSYASKAIVNKKSEIK